MATAASAQVVVSSKIDTEGGVLGNIIYQVLEANGIAVEDRLQLGGTPIVREAITAGQIDIYPEYTGNAAFFFDVGRRPVWNDAQARLCSARPNSISRTNGSSGCSPSPANNTWAIAVRQDVAEENGLATLSDFGEYVAGGGEVILAASTRIRESSPAALPAFQAVYGFELSSDQLITLSGGDTAATIAAAAQQTSGANAAMVYGTDGGIAPSGLVVMEDDMGVQPVYLPAPIIRAGGARRASRDRGSAGAGFRGPDPRGAPGPQWPRAGGRRTRRRGGGRLPDRQRVLRKLKAGVARPPLL